MLFSAHARSSDFRRCCDEYLARVVQGRCTSISLRIQALVPVQIVLRHFTELICLPACNSRRSLSVALKYPIGVPALERSFCILTKCFIYKAGDSGGAQANTMPMCQNIKLHMPL